MVEDLGFSVRRVRISDPPSCRMLIDADRADAGSSGTRTALAYGTVPAVRADDDRNEPSSWTIF
jgi:hypothetical protein